jgi:hypothetical protein
MSINRTDYHDSTKPFNMKTLVHLFLAIVLLVPCWESASASDNRTLFQTPLQKKRLELKSELSNHAKSAMFLNNTPGNPGKSSEYSWWNEEWFHAADNQYTYDEMGRLIEQIMQDPIMGMDLTMISYGYDDYDNMTEYLVYYWEEEWVLNYGNSTQFVYSPEGFILEETFMFYDYLNGWINSAHIVRVFDSEGRLVEEIYEYWYNGEWSKNYRDVYGYDDKSGEWTSLTSFLWNGEEWQEDYQVIDIVWLNFEEMLPASATTQQNFNGTWFDYERYTGTMDGEVYILVREMFWGEDWVLWDRETHTKSPMEDILLIEYYDQNSKVWTNSQRDTEYMDEMGYYSGAKYEYWEQEKKTSQAGWVIDYYDNWDNTYNSEGQLEETIIQYWDGFTSSLVNSTRFVYSEFTSSDIAELGSDLGLQIYPNPANDFLHVTMVDLQGESFQYQLLDITGKTVNEGNLMNERNSIDLRGIQKGLYMLRAYSEDGLSSTYKILKR